MTDLTSVVGSDLPVLYSFRRCPYAMRARLALAAADQQCELREVVLRDKPHELLVASPKGTVPVLVLPDSTVIDESLAIMLWALSRNDPLQCFSPDRETHSCMLLLISRFDGDFKHHLDRYKYPDRYEGGDQQHHRAQGAALLHQLNDSLNATAYLFGTKPTLADMAIAPFVRQYALTDFNWFSAQPWPQLVAWLNAFTQSMLYMTAMHKYARWISGTSGEPFLPLEK